MSPEITDLLTWLALVVVALLLLAGAVWALVSPFDFDD